MSDDSEDRTDETASEDEDAEEAEFDPEQLDNTEQYDDRHEAARETANPDDHRDEPPHES